MCVLVTQSCLTLCDPMDCSPPGSSVHGILQARILEWVAISSLWGIFSTQGSNLGLLPALWEDSLPSEPLRNSPEVGIPNIILFYTGGNGDAEMGSNLFKRTQVRSGSAGIKCHEGCPQSLSR